MTKILKYVPKHLKEQILSERIIDRFRQKNLDEGREVDD